jgi:hypothetical protein
MITRLLFRVALVVAFALSAGAYLAHAQYNISLRFDTVTANPGDTVTVNVYYKFTSAIPQQNVQDFNARFLFDSSELHLIAYILDGTASAGLSDTTGSHDGLAALGDFGESLDFTNPILFKIRFGVDRRLADTAFIKWDTNWSVFDYFDSINVSQQNGWIRTQSTSGRVTLSTPSMTVDTGEVFSVPVSISGIENANIDSAVLMFEFDDTDLQFRGSAAATSSNAVVDTAIVSKDTISIVLKAVNGHIAGSDSTVTISFYSVPWYDTACVAFQDIRFEALDSTSLIGNTVSSSGLICIVPGSKPPADVNPTAVKPDKFVAYPNPAWGQVTFSAGPGINAGLVTIEVYDALGREVFESNDAYPVWQIPSNIRPGTYLARMETETGRFTTCLVIEP